MKKVACFVADGFEEVELVSVVDVLRRGGVQADLISISGELPVSAHQVVIRADVAISDVRMSDYDAIFIPGGSRGANNLKNDEAVIGAIRDFHKKGKAIAAICAGPAVLEEAGILAGHAGTSYPGFEEDLSFDFYTEDLVVTSGNVVTSRGPGTALLLGFELLRQLDLNDKADRIWQEMLMDQLAGSFGESQARTPKWNDSTL